MKYQPGKSGKFKVCNANMGADGKGYGYQKTSPGGMVFIVIGWLKTENITERIRTRQFCVLLFIE